MLDRTGQHRVGDTGESTGLEVLEVGQVPFATGGVGAVALLEIPTCGVESAKLDGNAGTNADERRESTLVEREGSFGLVDGRSGVQSGRVLGGSLETDFDNVEGLAWW